MLAIKRRRGSAAILVRGFGGLPFWSGGNFKIGSAKALLLLRRSTGWILNGVAHVFLDRFQLVEQAIGVGRIDAFERGCRQLGTQPAQFAQQRTRSLAQIEAAYAAAGIPAPPSGPAPFAPATCAQRRRHSMRFPLFLAGSTRATP